MTYEQAQARLLRDYYEAQIQQKEAELSHARLQVRKARRDLAAATEGMAALDTLMQRDPHWLDEAAT